MSSEYNAENEVEHLCRRVSELETALARVRIAFDHIDEALFVQDAETGAVIDANEQAYAMFGYSKAEADQISIKKLSFGQPPYTESNAMRYVKKAAEGEPQRFQWRAKHKDGHLFWVEVGVRLAILDQDKYVMVTARDITERKKSEEALRDTESRLYTIIDSVPQSIFWKDTKSVYLGCNKNFAKAAGLSSSDEIVGKTDFDLPWPKEDAEKYRMFDRQVIETGEPTIHMVESLLQADGTQIWIDTSKVPLSDQNGRTYGVVGIYTDVTERLKYEQDLIESEHRYAMAERAAEIGSWDWSIESNELHWSEQAASLFGFQPGQFTGTYEAFLDKVYPEDRQYVIDSVNAAISGEIDYSIQHRIVCPDDVIRWVSEIADVYRDDNGNAIRMVGVVQDITDRKKAEEKLLESSAMLELVLDSIPAWVFWKDRNSVYLGCNRLFAENAGLSSPKEIIGKTDFDLPWRDTEAESYVRDDRNVIETAIPKIAYEETQKTARGEIMWLRTSKMPLRDLEGNVIGVLGTFEDITKRKEAELALLESAQRLRLHFEQTPLIVMEWDKNAIITRWNNSAEQVFGYTAEEAIGQHVNLIVPESARRHVADVFECLFAENDGRRSTNENITKSGKIITCEWYNTPLKTADGQVIGIASLGQDITERLRAVRALKQSELRFKAIFDKAPIGIAMVNTATGRLMQANARYCEIIGREGTETLERLQAITHPDDVQADLENMKRLLSSETRFYYLEKRYIKPDESIVWVGVTVVPMWGEGETPTSHIVLLEDITEQKHLEEEKRSFYRQTIFAVTGGKLDIVDQSDIDAIIADVRICCQVTNSSDVGSTRHSAQEACRSLGLEDEGLNMFMIGVGEAITNAVKHATRGQICAGRRGDEVFVSVSDNGSGIASLILPDAVLRRGFSTKPSLGLGYSIMIEVSDRIKLKSDESGTTVVLFKNIHPIKPSLDSIPDTWQGIPNV